MRVLVACEYSGVVREAFKKKGHDAWSVDILPTEIEGNHIQDDVLNHIDKGWDLMIAHPPCTYLSNAGARFLYPKGILNEERYKKGLVARDI
jgi:site-specific DNA-cytosine methylase